VARRRRPQALQQQVVQAEGQVEGRVAPAGAFGVQQHRARRADQDVLRAHVAVHQRVRVRLCLRHQGLQRAGQVGMTLCGGQQVGLEPDVEEDRFAVEQRCQLGRPCRGVRMHPRQRATHGLRGAGVGLTRVQHALSTAGVRRRQPLHHQHAQARVLTQQLRCAPRLRHLRHLHPARFVPVALNRRMPVGCHAQLRQGTLGTHRAARGVDAPDVG
jgi:hypothetical protein